MCLKSFPVPIIKKKLRILLSKSFYTNFHSKISLCNFVNSRWYMHVYKYKICFLPRTHKFLNQQFAKSLKLRNYFASPSNYIRIKKGKKRYGSSDGNNNERESDRKHRFPLLAKNSQKKPSMSAEEFDQESATTLLQKLHH